MNSGGSNQHSLKSSQHLSFPDGAGKATQADSQVVGKSNSDQDKRKVVPAIGLKIGYSCLAK
ncbi:hypothetical protein ES703_51306 [subsurface metagenome]